MTELPVGRLLSIQIGQPERRKTAQGRVWESAIGKRPVSGPVTILSENVAGDVQFNRKYHGGPDKAVCVYSAEHFALWNREFEVEMSPGAFGENLTVSGLLEDAVCLGDVLAIGDVRLQVSQPRMPCANVAKRWNRPTLPERMMETGFTGFYCRVLQTGEVEAECPIEVVERPAPDWTMLRMNQTLYPETVPIQEIEVLVEHPLITGEWRRGLRRKRAKLG